MPASTICPEIKHQTGANRRLGIKAHLCPALGGAVSLAAHFLRFCVVYFLVFTLVVPHLLHAAIPDAKDAEDA